MKVVLKAFSIFIFLIFFLLPRKSIRLLFVYSAANLFIINVSVKWLALLGSIFVSFSCSLLLAYVC